MLAGKRWLLLGLGARLASAIELDITNADSIKSAASTLAFGMMSTYTGNNTGDVPGNLPSPYFWWEAGAMFMHMVEYWYYTGDTTYNAETNQAITFQNGNNGFMPPNQTKSEGNDDQVFWAFAAMSAAELGFEPPVGDYPSWTAMAQTVFNLQTERWDTETCDGGLRWQIFQWNNGYDYRNVAANGGFFQLACRLARYTGNKTYVEWAEKEWDWFSNSVLYDTTTHKIFDGTDDTTNCTTPNIQQFSYNYGIIIGGLAYIYNHTQDEKWLTELTGIIDQTFTTFFPENKIITEIICEANAQCGTDNLTFKSFTIRWLAVAAQLVPQLADQIWPYIQASAMGAAGQCDGNGGSTCGQKWTTTTWDGTSGVGQQMSALAVVQANLITVNNLKPPLTLDNGGTSKSDPNASSSGGTGTTVFTEDISTSDKAGAGILTALALSFILGGTYWLFY